MTVSGSSSSSTGSTTHEVKEGDTIISIALQYGFRTWETIWEHEKNAELRAKRPDPGVLAAGDKVYVAAKKPKELKVNTNERHKFVVKQLKAHLRVVVGDDRGVFPDARFAVTIDEKDYTGQTDSKGLVDVQIPASAKTGVLKVWPKGKSSPLEWELQLGHLDPADETTVEKTAFKGRLMNLGYDVGEDDDSLKKAIAAFQEDNDLESTGEMDDTTKAAILRLHRG